jgi:nucleoid DNA-binding protein
MAATKAKATAKKAPAKAPAKKAAAPKAAAPKATKKASLAVKERYSKSDILNHISTQTELTRKQVTAVLDELNTLIEAHISKKGPGEFVMPGLLKIVTVKKPARKARKGINPFTGEETTFAAKPASIQVKVRPLKKMKEMVE